MGHGLGRLVPERRTTGGGRVGWGGGLAQAGEDGLERWGAGDEGDDAHVSATAWAEPRGESRRCGPAAAPREPAPDLIRGCAPGSAGRAGRDRQLAAVRARAGLPAAPRQSAARAVARSVPAPRDSGGGGVAGAGSARPAARSVPEGVRRYPLSQPTATGPDWRAKRVTAILYPGSHELAALLGAIGSVALEAPRSAQS